MSTSRFVRRAALGIAAPITVIGFTVIGAGLAHGDVPSPGDSCTALHSTTRDADGKTMWCNPTMTGDHSLVWQYGGPA